MTNALETAAFPGFIDLASERLGGKALIASDDYFAPKENLLKPGRGVFIPDKYTDRGKWMDGWESRRKRTPGHDWCIIKLGLRGIVNGIDIDTNHFLGNNPAYASIDGCVTTNEATPSSLLKKTIRWSNILPKSPLRPGSQNLFSIPDRNAWTHLRLNIFPDGGVARFRAYGSVVPDWGSVGKKEPVDLAAIEYGGLVTAASDMFFGSRENLIMPGRAKNMGDGWETRRRRGPGSDWAVVQLGRAGRIAKVEVDTSHFKGNFPDECSIDACHLPNTVIDALTVHQVRWKELLPRTKLKADTRHFFTRQLKSLGDITHVRLNVFPDGGVSRLRVYGTITS